MTCGIGHMLGHNYYTIMTLSSLVKIGVSVPKFVQFEGKVHL